MKIFPKKNENDTLICDGYCETCNSCLYDITPKKSVENNSVQRTTKDIKYCNGCRFAKRTQNANAYYNTWVCGKFVCGDKTNVTIDFNVHEGNLVRKPSWCPLTDSDFHESTLSPSERCKLWEKIKPITKYEEIASNKWYHVPPLNGNKRYDVYVIHKYLYSMEVVKRGETVHDYLSAKSLDVKFMTEIK